MKWFLDLTTRGKLLAVLLLTVVFLATVIVVAYPSKAEERAVLDRMATSASG